MIRCLAVVLLALAGHTNATAISVNSIIIVTGLVTEWYVSMRMHYRLIYIFNNCREIENIIHNSCNLSMMLSDPLHDTPTSTIQHLVHFEPSHSFLQRMPLELAIESKICALRPIVATITDEYTGQEIGRYTLDNGNHLNGT
jgi:hypothetical protein